MTTGRPAMASSSVSKPACCHMTSCSRSRALAFPLGRRHHMQPFRHSAQHTAPRRAAYFCEAAKRPGSKKKQPPPQSKGDTKGDERPEVPAVEPVQSDSSTQQHSEREEAQQVEAEVVPASESSAGTQQPQASSGAEPELKAAELRRQLQQQQQAASAKPSLLEGVLREVGLIEWPSIPSALLNTMLVVSIVAGVSLMLFFVNTLLAETSQALYGLKSVK